MFVVVTFLPFGGLAHLISMIMLLFLSVVWLRGLGGLVASLFMVVAFPSFFLSVVWSRGLEDLVASCLFVVLLFSSFSGGGMNGITFEAHNLFFAMT